MYSSQFFSKFTKRISLIQQQCFLNYSIRNEGILYSYLQKERSFHIVDKSKKILFNEHALKRWNQRVGPVLTDEELRIVLNAYYQLNRFRMDDDMDNKGIIDNDIRFTYEMNDDSIFITTFYGRKSVNPAIQNLSWMKHFNKKERDLAHLDLNQEELKQQVVLVPKELMVFRGGYNTYQLEEYPVKGGDRTVFLVSIIEHDAAKLKDRIIIDTKTPEKKKLNKSILKALRMKRHERFLYDNIKHFYPQKYRRLVKTGT